MAQLLLQNDCTVTIAHSRTRDLPALCARSGDPGRGDRPAEGGRRRMDPARRGRDRRRHQPRRRRQRQDATGRRCRLRGALAACGAITPVPGGVGPMTIACLLLNTLNAALRSRWGTAAELLETVAADCRLFGLVVRRRGLADGGEQLFQRLVQRDGDRRRSASAASPPDAGAPREESHV